VQLSPRYDGPPILEVDGVADPSVPLLRQARRFIGALEQLTGEQWAHPTRCDGWSALDVVLHLSSAFGFWVVSVQRGLAGEPTRYLLGFDPVATPAQLVEGARGSDPAEVVAGLAASVDALDAAVTGLDVGGWATIAEAPPGHVALRAVLLHALWDSWVHERDVFLPQGVATVEDDEEIAAILHYAVGLSPAFAASMGEPRTATLVVEVVDPALRLAVEAGPTVRVRRATDDDGPAQITGRAVEVLEGLSVRAPLDATLADEDRWVLTGLTTVFDQ
jgi:uncharacterized protein (TIGR03083 family)